jgi:hypothetical protein
VTIRPSTSRKAQPSAEAAPTDLRRPISTPQQLTEDVRISRCLVAGSTLPATGKVRAPHRSPRQTMARTSVPRARRLVGQAWDWRTEAKSFRSRALDLYNFRARSGTRSRDIESRVQDGRPMLCFRPLRQCVYCVLRHEFCHRLEMALRRTPGAGAASAANYGRCTPHGTVTHPPDDEPKPARRSGRLAVWTLGHFDRDIPAAVAPEGGEWSVFRKDDEYEFSRASARLWQL